MRSRSLRFSKIAVVAATVAASVQPAMAQQEAEHQPTITEEVITKPGQPAAEGEQREGWAAADERKTRKGGQRGDDSGRRGRDRPD